MLISNILLNMRSILLKQFFSFYCVCWAPLHKCTCALYSHMAHQVKNCIFLFFCSSFKLLQIQCSDRVNSASTHYSLANYNFIGGSEAYKGPRKPKNTWRVLHYGVFISCIYPIFQFSKGITEKCF